MRSFLEHFAFIVFLFVCVSHYVANAEIHIYPASLDSVIRTNLQSHSSLATVHL